MTSTTRRITVGPAAELTVVAEVGGLRPLTDPTVRPPGVTPGSDGALSTRPPTVHVDDISYSAIDVVLPSYDQHGDHLDQRASTQTARRPLAFTTGSAAPSPGRFARVMTPRHHINLPWPMGPRMTALPAAHERANRDDTHGSASSAVDI
jgi:hypothetical protein